MKKAGKFELYSLNEALDRHFGPVGTAERDAHEARVAEAVHSFELKRNKKWNS